MVVYSVTIESYTVYRILYTVYSMRRRPNKLDLSDFCQPNVMAIEGQGLWSEGGVLCKFSRQKWDVHFVRRLCDGKIIDDNISKFIVNYPNENSCRINEKGKIKINKMTNGMAANRSLVSGRPWLWWTNKEDAKEIHPKFWINLQNRYFISIFVEPACINF